jgi:hypothetical protein
MEVRYSSETAVDFQRTTRSYISKLMFILTSTSRYLGCPLRDGFFTKITYEFLVSSELQLQYGRLLQIMSLYIIYEVKKKMHSNSRHKSKKKLSLCLTQN